MVVEIIARVKSNIDARLLDVDRNTDMTAIATGCVRLTFVLQ